MMLPNREHLAAFVWLRWRLQVNQLRKSGTANIIVFLFAKLLPIVAAVGVAVVGFLLGAFALEGESPTTVMYVWDGAILGFLFLRLISLMIDVQRTESLSIEKFLHLPVSPAGVFLVNYLSSLIAPILGIAVAGFIGLTLGSVISQGALMLLTLPATAALVFAVSAVIHQFQGWLATLMSNPRRRRTIVACMTLGMILLAQTPQLFTMFATRGNVTDSLKMVEDINAENEKLVAVTSSETQRHNAALKALSDKQNTDQSAAGAELATGKLNSESYRDKLDALGKAYKANVDRAVAESGVKSEQIRQTHFAEVVQDQADRKSRKDDETRVEAERTQGLVRTANAVVPLGWPALAAWGAADGNIIPALLGTLGLTAIGAWSLRRAYRTTLRLYTGGASNGGPAVAARPPEAVGPRKLSMAEWQLPWIDEQAAGVAAAGLRSLIRAPESKMMLFAPFFFLIIFGTIIASIPVTVPELLRPLIAGGGIGMVLLAGLQLVGNQFGYDRGGFRAYVLAPVPRRSILLGRNLAASAFVLGSAWLIIAAVGIALPMRFDHLLAVFCQSVSMFLLFCVVANGLSILAPLPIAPGGMQPSSVKFLQVLAQMLAGLLLPVVTAPTFLPLGVEALLVHGADWGTGWPIAFVLTVLLLVGVALAYGRVLTWEGRLLQQRERDVLVVVTSKEE